MIFYPCYLLRYIFISDHEFSARIPVANLSGESSHIYDLVISASSVKDAKCL